MKRMPILIACAATLAAACGAGIGMSRPGNSVGLATSTPSATPAQANGGIASSPSSAEVASGTAHRDDNAAATVATNQPAAAAPVSAVAPAPTAPAPLTPAPVPTAAAPTVPVDPLSPVIRRLALQAQAQPATPYQPQSVSIVDQVSPGSDFDQFRARLRLAVRDRDEAFLRQVANEHITLSFGGGMSLDSRFAEADAPIWQALARAIGGDCAGEAMPNGTYMACPASFAVEADHPTIDPYMMVYVDGTDVAVRQLPSPHSPVLTRVSNSLLQSVNLPWDEALSEAENAQLNAWYQASETAEGWKFVSLPDGRKGFISSRYAYSSLGYRAIFQRTDAGAWEMSAFVAGD